MSEPRRQRLVVLASLFAVLGASTTADAATTDPDRYALVIGSNLGEPDETRLLYAERDAARVADSLVRLAGVPAQNLVLLRTPDAASVESVLHALADRIGAHAAQTGGRPLLFVYYSGHADVSTLHLAGTMLPFQRFKELVVAAGAEVNVFVMDACRSGGLTRVKGAKPAAPFEIHAEDTLDSTGLAIITSSAADEDAQESERLQGGIFTHHLLTGLRGAADTSKDSRVTLSEAYQYAYNQTLRTTTRTRFIQHPTYAFRIKGRQELVVARTSDSAGLGRLRLEAGGRYVVMEESGDGSVVAELVAEPLTDVLMSPGRYLVRRRDDRSIWESTIGVHRDEVATVSANEMTRVPYGATVRRGLSPKVGSVWSLGAAFEAGGPLLDATDLGLYGAVGVQLDTKDIALQLRFRYGRAGGGNDEAALTQDQLGLDLGAFHLFDLGTSGGDVALGLGIRAGADWLQQSFETTGEAPTRSQVVGRLAPLARFEWTVANPLTLGIDCGAEVYFLELEGTDGARELSTPVVPFCNIGFGVYLP